MIFKKSPFLCSLWYLDTPSNAQQITRMKTQSTFEKTQAGWEECGREEPLMVFAWTHRNTQKQTHAAALTKAAGASEGPTRVLSTWT